MATKKYRRYNEGDLQITELKRGERYSVRVRFPPDDEHPQWWYSKSRKVNAPNKAEAVKAGLAYKAELRQSMVTGTDIDATIGQYAQEWQESRKKQGTVKQDTIERDQYEIDRIVHYLGGIKLRECTSDHIIKAYDKMSEDGVSKSARSKTHQKLRQILERAVNAGTIPRNPCRGIEGMARPKVTMEKRDEQRVDQDDLMRIFDILESEEQDGKRVGVWIAAITGMRRGEVMALTWRNIDLDHGVIRVRHQRGKSHELDDTKTPTSVRDIPLCAEEDIKNDRTMVYLRRWKERQQALFKEDYAKRCRKRGLKVPKWSEDAPVATNIEGGWQGVDNFGRWRRGWYVKHGLAYYDTEETYTDAAGRRRTRRKGYHGPNLHSLRHTQATVLIGSGMDVKSTQNRLGHAQASTTLNIYAEAQKSKERSAASLMSRLISKESDTKDEEA